MDTSATTDDSDTSGKTFQSFSFHSVSSTSDISSENDFINVEPKLITIPPMPNDNGQHENRPPDMTTDQPVLINPKPDIVPKVKPVMESPRVQMMERTPPEFDPNRIPQSVFVGKSSGPTDWSAASTESLFSIHIGTSSFKDLVVSVVPEEKPQTERECVVSQEEKSNLGPPTNEVRDRKILEEKEFMEVENRISQQDEITGEGVKITSVNTADAQNGRSHANLPFPELSFKHQANGPRMKQNTKMKKRPSECCCSGCTCEFCCSVKLSCCFCKYPRCDCCELSRCENICRWPACKFLSCKMPSHHCCKLPSCKNFCSFKCWKWPSCDGCCSSKCCSWPSCGNCFSSKCCSFKCCKWPSCGNCCSFKCCMWPSCENCCSSKCCKWPRYENCCSFKCCKWPSCGDCCCCKSCKWPSCGSCCKWPTCGGCSGCCKWPSCGCKNCCKWPSCGCKNCCQWPTCVGCCKCPSCNCKNCCDFSGCCQWPSCNCTSCCKWPSCSWSKGCLKWPSSSCCFPSCKWSNVFCCFSGLQRSRRPSRRSRQTSSWFSSIFCFSNCR